MCFNIACLPSFFSNDIISASSAAHSDAVDASVPISFFIHGNLDCLDAENVAYRVGSDQTFLVRKLSSESFVSLYSALPASVFIISYLYPLYNEIFIQLCTIKIIGFMQAKDGMV